MLLRCRFPLVPRDVRLFEKTNEEVHADVSTMWIGEDQPAIATEEEFVTPAWVRTVKPKRGESLDQVTTRDRNELPHHAWATR